MHILLDDSRARGLPCIADDHLGAVVAKLRNFEEAAERERVGPDVRPGVALLYAPSMACENVGVEALAPDILYHGEAASDLQGVGRAVVAVLADHLVEDGAVRVEVVGHIGVEGVVGLQRMVCLQGVTGRVGASGSGGHCRPVGPQRVVGLGGVTHGTGRHRARESRARANCALRGSGLSLLCDGLDFNHCSRSPLV